MTTVHTRIRVSVDGQTLADEELVADVHAPGTPAMSHMAEVVAVLSKALAAARLEMSEDVA